jgi:hypothetical protein
VFAVDGRAAAAGGTPDPGAASTTSRQFIPSKKKSRASLVTYSSPTTCPVTVNVRAD